MSLLGFACSAQFVHNSVNAAGQIMTYKLLPPPMLPPQLIFVTFFCVSHSPSARRRGLHGGSACVSPLQSLAPRRVHSELRKPATSSQQRRRGEERNLGSLDQPFCFLYQTRSLFFAFLGFGFVVFFGFIFFTPIILLPGAAVPGVELRSGRSSLLAGVCDSGAVSTNACPIPDLQTSLSLSWPAPAATW